MTLAKTTFLVAITTLAACAVDAQSPDPSEQRIVEAPQPAAAKSRWYTPGMPNRANVVRYYAGYLPSDANQHLQGTLAALQAYNDSTGIRFEPAPVVHTDSGFELPDPEDP